jgi:chemotaxis protein MotB
MAKLKVVSAPPPMVEDEDDEPDCPRCPPVGAPAWMATFADMATLLMAFFVLILSFANFDEVSFKKMTGSLRDHFGVQIIDIAPNPENTTILDMNSPPASDPPSAETQPDPEEEAKDSPAEAELQELTEALQEALKDGEVTVMGEGGAVTVRLPEGSGAGELAKAIAAAASDIAGAAGAASGEGTAPGADAARQPGDVAGADPESEDAAAPGDGGASATSKAAIAEARLKVALREIEGEGLVDVQKKDGKVVVTVGAGGSFGSGSADLTDQAREIMARIALSAMGDDGQITVTGHTDDVPLTGGPLVDNWGLSAARASSVVRELSEAGGIDPSRLSAVGKGDSSPVADNATEAGRSANRRIEIVLDFAEAAELP